MHSAIYSGVVRHRRRRDGEHRFAYRLFQVYLDLDELDALQAPGGPLQPRLLRPWRFCRRDYLGPAGTPLREAVLDAVQARLGVRPDGPVRMLTNLRTFGFVFNPVTFYYCFDRGERLRGVLAEITNTPWRQRHCYAVAADADGRGAAGAFAKEFHVSPFQPMQQGYVWRFTAPGDVLQVGMQNLAWGAAAAAAAEGEVVFDASLSMQRRELSVAELRRCWRRHPCTSAKVVLAIHCNALRLWWKGARFHVHPDQRRGRAPRPQPTGRESSP